MLRTRTLRATALNRPPSHCRAGLRLILVEPLGGAFLGEFLLGGGNAIVVLDEIALPHDAETPAFGAPAVRRVVRKQAWVQLFERFPALGATHFRAQHDGVALRVDQPRGSLADFQRPVDDLARIVAHRGVLEFSSFLKDCRHLIHDARLLLRAAHLAHHHVDGVLAETLQLLKAVRGDKFGRLRRVRRNRVSPPRPQLPCGNPCAL